MCRLKNLCVLGCLWLAGAVSAPAQTLSSESGWVVVASTERNILEIWDSQQRQVRSYTLPMPAPIALKDAITRHVVLREQPSRKSFVAAFPGSNELWEISYDRNAEPIYDGLVHDYRNGEAIAKPGFLGVRRTRLDEPLDNFFIDSESPHVLGVARWGNGEVQVINLDIRRKIATLALPDVPQLGKAFIYTWRGLRLIAIPQSTNEINTTVSVFDVKSWTPCAAVDAHEAAATLFKSQPSTPQ